MEIDKDKIKTLEETDEAAPMDIANDRVEAEMKKLEVETKEEVAEGLRHDKPTNESQRQRKEATDELKRVANDGDYRQG
ncbi:MAG TPA: hypothetical protein VIB00_14670 [Pyrinomonadaceae bacterium]|jgi:hypothetical protein